MQTGLNKKLRFPTEAGNTNIRPYSVLYSRGPKQVVLVEVRMEKAYAKKLTKYQSLLEDWQ